MGTTSFLKIDEKRLDSSICHALNEISDTLHPNVYWVKQAYKQKQFRSLWVTSEKIYKCDTLVRFLKTADTHGLASAFFISDSLRHQIRLAKTERLSYYELAKIDIQLTFSYLNYASAIIYGIVRPEKELPNYHFITPSADSTFVARLLFHQQTNLFHFMTAMQLKDNEYSALMAERKYWLKFMNDTFPVIPYLPTKKTLRSKEISPLIPFIIERLKITGELPEDYSDTITFLDNNILAAIDKFRSKVGLKPGDDIGNYTIRNLNMSPAEWIEKVDINLERNRWVNHLNGKKKYIRVNVADMTLRAYRNDSAILDSKICVGRTPENRTPFLQSKITEIVLNPVWSVPSSIIVKEISKTVQKDTAYFKRNQIKVYHKGKEVNPLYVDWTKISKENQPFRMVQDAGEINSLGKIKFNFSNPYGVYLHDTNSKRAFLRQNRAVSHGCVRVEKPLELTFFCLPDFDPQINISQKERNIKSDKIRHAIKLPVLTSDGKEMLGKDSLNLKSNRLNLSPPILLLIDYRTCFVDKYNRVVYTQDIYNMDSLLRQTLLKKLHPITLFH